VPTVTEVTLLAEPSLRPTPHQLHGLACTLLEGVGADHNGQDKPWTVWPLRAAGPTTSDPAAPLLSAPSVPLVLRLTWLPDDQPPPVSGLLPDQVRLGSRFATVASSNTIQTTFGQLADVPPARRAEMVFHRPTYFSRSGRNLPLPDPVLVVASLARRWNRFCPQELAIPDADVGVLRRTVMLADVAGHSERVDRDPTAIRSGFVGEATLTLPRSCPTSAARWFAALCSAAEFCGVGAGTTSGFGVVTARVGS
jgi:CRISPR-associated endoribonuclease Cas6